MTDLASRRCVPCEKGTPPLEASRTEALLVLIPRWDLRDGKLHRDFALKSFQEALNLVNAIGGLAEAEGHHPNLSLHSWNHVLVELYTHSVGGLSENDFILAAKIDRLNLPTC